MVTLINTQLPKSLGKQQIRIDDRGIVEEIALMQPANSDRKEIIDLEGDWISLGGLDLQINGGLGLAFPELQEKDLTILKDICEFLWTQGIDGFLPTIITTSVENIQRALTIIDKFIDKYNREVERTAKILGIHLEGPFLNYEKRGAHPARYLMRPSIEAIEEILGDYAHRVKIITLAPELDIDGEVISYLHSLGIVVSLGHSEASAEQARKAFELGASMVTHAFNAMPPLHHRKPGLLAEAILNKNVYCGLIADAKHVCPSMIEILLRASDYDRGVFLISDALAAIGLEDGVYPWDERTIEVREGTARLANGTLAGTTLPLLKGVNNLVKWGVCDVGTAIALATESPRKAIGLPGLSVGQRANLLRWHWEEETKELTWKRLDLDRFFA